MVQGKCIVIMTKKESTKVVNAMTPGAGVLLLRSGDIGHIVKCIISLTFFSLLPAINKTN